MWGGGCAPDHRSAQVEAGEVALGRLVVAGGESAPALLMQRSAVLRSFRARRRGRRVAHPGGPSSYGGLRAVPQSLVGARTAMDLDPAQDRDEPGTVGRLPLGQDEGQWAAARIGGRWTLPVRPPRERPGRGRLQPGVDTPGRRPSALGASPDSPRYLRGPGWACHAHSHMTDAKTLLGELSCKQSRAARLRPAFVDRWAFAVGDSRGCARCPQPPRNV